MKTRSEDSEHDDIPSWMAPLLEKKIEMFITEDDSDELAEIVKKSYIAERDSVVIPFESSKLEDALKPFAMKAAAGSLHDGHFAVLLCEESDSAIRYEPVGEAELLEGPLEDATGEVYARWQWFPSGGTIGFNGLFALIINKVTEEICGRGVLRCQGDQWFITLEQGQMNLLHDITAENHSIWLKG